MNELAQSTNMSSKSIQLFAQFRICGTGAITELSHSFSIVKKLKLIGQPFRYFFFFFFLKKIPFFLEFSKIQHL
jgi:hypothetical protein